MPNLQWLLKSLLGLCLLTSLAHSAMAQTDTESGEPPSTATTEFETLVHELPKGSLSKRGQTIKALAMVNDERVPSVIEALQQGNLYADRGNPPTVAISTGKKKFIDALSGEALAADAAETLKRIPINNRMRGQLRTLLAAININHAQPDIRLKAIKQLISDGVDGDSVELLKTRQSTEPNTQVRDAITIAIALFNVESEDPAARLDAIALFSGSLEPEVRTKLKELAASDDNKDVRNKAQQTLNAIEDRIAVYRFGENVFFGLSLGSVLLLSAIGLAITFGVMGVINMAHGELMMIGAYTTWVVQQIFPNQITYSLLIAVPAAFVVAGLVGIAIERGVIRFLYGRPLETLLATFGISLILQQAARSIFSPLNRAVSLPDWMSGSMDINPVLSITYNRFYILIFGLVVFFVLMMILKKTSLGLKVRAVSQNRSMARAVGVRANWVDALTFGLGSGIAGIAGVALSQLTNVGPNLGQAYIIDSFMVVVFGGVGNLWGTLVGAMGLGIINKFLEPYAGAVLAKVLVLVLLILFIQKKPKGLFPQKGRAAAD
ncbi:urea ABC transporter permease subunit UrtB [Cellvibrio sp. ARAG 10.3]|uniref:urea ABC transporter permease subunit UrtB n=1 Tax=Cellvibrio sp. ARAG 10.3 TaxID=3451358 RepID=UPI003F46A7AC